MRALGLMSGTSLDGIDVALVDLTPRGPGYAVRLERFEIVPFDGALRSRLIDALPPNCGTVAAAAELHADLGAAFAAAARQVAGDDRVDYVASHGLTIYHDGARATTLQLGRPYELRDALQASVVWDFRSADCALGGEGAPLVPYVDAVLLASGEEDRVVVNLGGICNLTLLPRGCSPGDAIGFDCGPGMMLVDAFVRERTGDPYDRDGERARRGRADQALLARLLSDPYFEEKPPKSTGRERFGAQLLAAHRSALERLSVEDGCATLLAFTVRPLAEAIRAGAAPDARVILGGGGSRNGALIETLQRELP